jgi:hypothetical protein
MMPNQAPLGPQTKLLGDAPYLGNELGAVANTVATRCHPESFAVILSAAKDLALPLRVNSAKDLALPHSHEHTSQRSADVNVKSALRALRFEVAQ